MKKSVNDQKHIKNEHSIKIDFDQFSVAIIRQLLAIPMFAGFRNPLAVLSQREEIKIIMSHVLKRLIHPSSQFDSEEEFNKVAQNIAECLRKDSHAFPTVTQYYDSDGVEEERVETAYGISFDVYHEYYSGDCVSEIRFPEGLFLNASNLTVSLANALMTPDISKLNLFPCIQRFAGGKPDPKIFYGTSYHHTIFNDRVKKLPLCTEQDTLVIDVVTFLKSRCGRSPIVLGRISEEFIDKLNSVATIFLDRIFYNLLSTDQKKQFSLLLCYALHLEISSQNLFLSLEKSFRAVLNEHFHFKSYAKARAYTRYFFLGTEDSEKTSTLKGLGVDIASKIIPRCFSEEEYEITKEATFKNFCRPSSNKNT